MSKYNAPKKGSELGEPLQGEKQMVLAESDDRVFSHDGLWKISHTRQMLIRNLFKISSVTLLLAAFSAILSGQQSYSQSAGQQEDWLGQQSYSQSAGQQEDWLVYTMTLELEDENAMYEITIPYPSSWTQRDGTETGTESDDGLFEVSDFVSPSTLAGDFVDCNVYIQVNIPSDMNGEDILDASIESYTSNNHQILSSSVGDVSLGHLPAYILETTYTSREYGQQSMLEVGTIIDEHLFFVQCIADTPIYANYLPVEVGMISGIEISRSSNAVDTSSQDIGVETGDGQGLQALQAVSEMT